MPNLTVAEAVGAFEITRRTLQRHLAAGTIPGATKNPTGQWIIPAEGLHAAQIPPRQTWRDTAPNGATPDAPPAPNGAVATQKPWKTGRDTTPNGAPNPAPPAPTDATDARQRIRDLEQRLELSERLREAAERNAEDLRRSLRMLETRSSPPEPRTRRVWWGRTK